MCEFVDTEWNGREHLRPASETFKRQHIFRCEMSMVIDRRYEKAALTSLQLVAHVDWNGSVTQDYY